MNKIIFVLSLILILTLGSSMVFAESDIIVRIDSMNVEFNNEIGMPFIDENSRTLVPFRAAMEAYGAEVEWNSETRVALAKKGDIVVEAPIDENFILNNGEKVEIDTAAVIKDGRTYLPIRPVIEAFGSEVQWDKDLNTVVITTEPIDARGILMESYKKSAEWKNFDANLTMDMSMAAPNELDVVEKMEMLMDMKMTSFMDPMKVKASANMTVQAGEEFISQPLMEMYYLVEDDKFTTYMGMYNETGELNWMQSSIENEAFSDLLNYDPEASMELNEKSIKNVRFLGKYADESGKNLLKFENTTSFEAYSELLGDYMNMLTATGKEEDMLAADMLSNMGDMIFVIYVDEATSEIYRYEMDLSTILMSMFSGMSENEAMPAEMLEMFKSMEMTMVMDIVNINEAEDFEIPEEVLNATEMEDFLEESISE